MEKQSFIDAGKIVNTHGVRGEVRIEVWLDSPALLKRCGRVFLGGEEQKLLSDAPVSAPADALVLPMGEDLGPAVSAATALRSAGVRTQLYVEKKKFKAKMSYADRLQIPFVVFLGEDEIREGVVSVKDMASGEQCRFTPAAAAAFIREKIDAWNAAPVVTE